MSSSHWDETWRAEMRAVGATEHELTDMRYQVFDGADAAADLAAYRRRVEERRVEMVASDRRAMVKRGVGEIYLRGVYDQEPEQTDAIEAVRGFLSEERLTFLVMLGGVGVGKSAAAAFGLVQSLKATPELIQAACVARGGRDAFERRTPERTGYFLDARGLAALLRFEAHEEYEKVRACSLLVLDDLGAEHDGASGWMLSGVDALINIRYGACARTIITSNLDSKAFSARYGERIVDRLRESGRVVTIGGKSRRSRTA